MKVLIIEDDPKLARLIEGVLREEHFTVDVALDGETGLGMALAGAYDLAIVDWMLPRRDGPSILRAMRSAGSSTAVLMLTARGQVEDRVVGLNSGADDYLGKPFAFEELLARLRALGRRSTTFASRALGIAQRRPGPGPGGAHRPTGKRPARPDEHGMELARVPPPSSGTRR